MKSALLLIDMQQDFFHQGPLAERRNTLVANINQLVDAAHQVGMPVIWIRQEYSPDLSDAPLYNRRNNKAVTIQGTPGAALLPELHREKSDPEIIKKRFSAFFRTGLEKWLSKHEIERIIITGVNTMTCVRVTALDAYQRDLEVILALDSVDGHDQEQHDNSIKYLQFSATKGMRNPEIIEEIISSK